MFGNWLFFIGWVYFYHFQIQQKKTALLVKAVSHKGNYDFKRIIDIVSLKNRFYIVVR